MGIDDDRADAPAPAGGQGTNANDDALMSVDDYLAVDAAVAGAFGREPALARDDLESVVSFRAPAPPADWPDDLRAEYLRDAEAWPRAGVPIPEPEEWLAIRRAAEQANP